MAFDLDGRIRSATPRGRGGTQSSEEVEVDLQSLEGYYISMTAPEDGDSVISVDMVIISLHEVTGST